MLLPFSGYFQNPGLRKAANSTPFLFLSANLKHNYYYEPLRSCRASKQKVI